jgi:hypothetical protein
MPLVALSPAWGSFVLIYSIVHFALNGEWAVGSMLDPRPDRRGCVVWCSASTASRGGLATSLREEHPHGEDSCIRAEREKLRALMAGRSEVEDGRSELVRLAGRLIIEEALEGETRDALGRDYYARGARPGAGYRPPRPARARTDHRDGCPPSASPGCAGASASCWEPGVLVNYVDPDQPLCWAPPLQQEFCLTDGELGSPFSEFFWSYALMQIPTGMILDRFGVRKVYRVSAFLWSFTSAATASAIALEMLPL